jgi:hypothetical protein
MFFGEDFDSDETARNLEKSRKDALEALYELRGKYGASRFDTILETRQGRVALQAGSVAAAHLVTVYELEDCEDPSPLQMLKAMTRTTLMSEMISGLIPLCVMLGYDLRGEEFLSRFAEAPDEAS